MRAKLLFIGLFVTILSSSSSALARSSTKDEVVLTVSGEGKTTDEATKVALRSAISQAFGVFVSTNTTLLNDDLVKDEIATLTSGNIKKYKELTNTTLANGLKSVTLEATVSISNLISYSKSKGASAEFAGATFAMNMGMNMKMKELNKENERIALEHLADLMAVTLPFCYDIKCEVGEPTIPREQGTIPTYDLPLVVTFIPNKTAKGLNEHLIKSLESIRVSEKERAEYKRLNLDLTEEWYLAPTTTLSTGCCEYQLFLRNSSEWVSMLSDKILQIITLEALNFVVVDNVGNITSFTPKFEEHEYGFWGNDIKIKVLEPHMEINTKGVSTIEFIYNASETKGPWVDRKDWSPFTGLPAKRISHLQSWSPFTDPIHGPSDRYFASLLFIRGQRLYFTMRIPQADISKYSTFEVKKAYDNLKERLILMEQ